MPQLLHISEAADGSGGKIVFEKKHNPSPEALCFLCVAPRGLLKRFCTGRTDCAILELVSYVTEGGCQVRVEKARCCTSHSSPDVPRIGSLAPFLHPESGHVRRSYTSVGSRKDASRNAHSRQVFHKIRKCIVGRF